MWLNKFVSMMCGACEPQVLISGVTDVIVVRDLSTRKLRCSPFYICFGTDVTTEIGEKVLVTVNGISVPFNFHLDADGYLHPNIPPSEILEKFQLNEGVNTVEYTAGIPGTSSFASLKNEVFLYNSNDKLVVSDVDGTLTKSDVQGMYNNYHGRDYLHEGYANCMQAVHGQGYQVVWMTMRSLPMYNMSKEYIKKYVKIDGPLIMEPEDLMLAAKKEALTRTSDLVKATAMKNMKELFPKETNPFAGGFGNRENDSIAYHYAGMDFSNIYQIDVLGRIHRLSDSKQIFSYAAVCKDIEHHFPNIRKPRVRLYPA